MCHNVSSRPICRMRYPILCLCFAVTLSAANGEEFRVYTEHPRLFLRAQRLRLLKRERPRQSIRWEQFDTLARGVANLPEPGFSYGLEYAVTGDKALGRKAVAWAVGPGKDIRQIALVFDWCNDLLSEAESKQIAAKLSAALHPTPDLEAMRSSVLAAIAIADREPDASEHFLENAIDNWWRKEMAPKLENGDLEITHAHLFALMELLHAVRDNLNIDLRESCPKYFDKLAEVEITSYYPAPLQAAETDYRIPAFTGSGEPDLRKAALSRAAEMMMVAYDTNALENQFLQGWLMLDRFLLRDAFGAPYEFLWANPYQPGLSYTKLPLTIHEPRSGALFVRSSWDEDASWFGIVDHQLQSFHDGRASVLRPTARAKPELISLGPASVIVGTPPMKFPAADETIFVISLKPKSWYGVEVTDEELSQFETDPKGTLELNFPKGRKATVRLEEVPIATAKQE